MNEEKIVVPSIDEVVKLLTIAINNKIIGFKTIGELLGMKWADSLLPKFKNEPEWGYDGLEKFFIYNKLNFPVRNFLAIANKLLSTDGISR